MLGVYIHFPFCRSKCPYCDFAVHVVRDIPHREYADAVLRELALRAPSFERFGPPRSVAFGGGSPSLWDPEQVERVLAAVRAAFSPGGSSGEPIEVSLEANPEDLDAQGFRELRLAGVTRASIGVQSFDDGVLRGLGRGHDGEAARRSIAIALEAGFDSVSLDLIYGGPAQTEAIARGDAAAAAGSGVRHVSCYALTLEELAVDVPMAKWVRRGEVEVASADAQADLGAVVRGALEQSGFQRYEISNFAKPGAQSRHNLGYWLGEPYLGLGVGAFGADPALRYGNPRGLRPYFDALEAGELPAGERDVLDAGARLRERVFLGLRLVQGLALAEISVEHGEQSAKELVAAARPFVERGLAAIDDGRLRLTEAGLDLHSEIAARLMPPA